MANIIDESSSKMMYTLQDVCQITSLGRTFIYRSIAEGRLNAVKAGRKTLISKHALMEFLDDLPEM